MDLKQEIIKKFDLKKRLVIGFANLSQLPENNRRGYKYGISIGIGLKMTAVLNINKIPNTVYFEEYQEVNKILDNVAEFTSDLIKEYGYDAYPVCRKNIHVDKKTRRSELPVKTLATLAGLGWIGKCALLVTKEFGTAVRYAGVLTDAEFDTGLPVTASACGDCRECQKICQGNAVSGKNWQINMDRDYFFDAHKCRDNIKTRRIQLYNDERNVTCGLCIAACPWTKKYLRN